MTGKTCLVTGGAGFIGSWLCESLIGKGYGILCLDNFITGNRKNIEHLQEKQGFSLLEHDVSKPTEIEENVDFIFHLASPASPLDYQNLPVETMLANSLGTYNTLQLAKNKGSRYLLASTSEVYGDPEQHPQKEDYQGNVNPVGPRACYDESKRFGESLTVSFMKVYGLDARIVRIFNTYGPRMRKNDGRVIPNFITQALEGKPITVYGDGMQTRSFCYVNDLVRGLEGIMFAEKLNHRIFNLGNPDELSILEVAKRIKEMVGSGSEIIFQRLPEDDPVKRRPDIARIKENLGWEPKISFEEGLKETVEFFREERGWV